MQQHLYSIFDTKSREFSPPQIHHNDDVASRTVLGALTGDSMLSRFPQDYELHHVGTFDSEKGIFNSASPRFIVAISTLHQLLQADNTVPFQKKGSDK